MKRKAHRAVVVGGNVTPGVDAIKLITKAKQSSDSRPNKAIFSLPTLN